MRFDIIILLGASSQYFLMYKKLPLAMVITARGNVLLLFFRLVVLLPLGNDYDQQNAGNDQ